ncbi:hypothetical protein PNI0076_02443 [Streptococcus pneumoniae PNI0076]|nr:hypothetical protein PNI0076_02443 [Streptococcus pneumoniae PNI0076]
MDRTDEVSNHIYGKVKLTWFEEIFEEYKTLHNKTHITKVLMNCTPKVRQKKSNFWGVFIMKLSYDDKVQIYELRKQGYSLEKLSNKFGINNSNLRYMIKLIDR